MFDCVREDIAAGTAWHDVPFVRARFGETGARAAAVVLSSSLQVVLIYRLQAWAKARHVPVVPNVCRRITMLLAGVSIGDRVTIGPGLLINHGHVVIDGLTTIGPLCSIAPFVTIGLNTGGPDASFDGPTVGRFVFVGTGAKLLGPITIGDNARIGANAVVLDDVPPNATAVGAPARSIPHQSVFGAAQKS